MVSPVSANLTEKPERSIQEEIERGRYNSKSELLRDALRLKMVERKFDTRGIEGRIDRKLEDLLKDVWGLLITSGRD